MDIFLSGSWSFFGLMGWDDEVGPSRKWMAVKYCTQTKKKSSTHFFWFCSTRIIQCNPMWWVFTVAKRPLNFERHQEIHSESHSAYNYTRCGTVTGARAVELSQQWPLSYDQANRMISTPCRFFFVSAQHHDAASYSSTRLCSHDFQIISQPPAYSYNLVGQVSG